ncbi:MAG: 2-succinyl-5-enolpyruvyl-6-hydroxy-3-cyclohexene-1-carboxylic-acid synthase, partial [Muribaculaceae bacterium]|nr:2-succinyl-5-enolpyruvyl-6-hydroxy-3-cyclohexene-1-carboxylic-acid synthase [Muribaculaceae bacterium]
MKDTDIAVCRQLAVAARAAGVRYVIASPGTRNAPLTLAFKSCMGLEVLPVVDERSAAFIALGIAARSGSPVIIECTSGTAPLNYAPAMAEAYYRHLPLVAITADRPADAINQNVAQTINQIGIYHNFVCAEYDISSTTDSKTTIKEAFKDIKGPIHINVHINEPLNGLCETESENFELEPVAPDTRQDRSSALELK